MQIAGRPAGSQALDEQMEEDPAPGASTLNSREGFAAGPELEKAVKLYKSHRRVSVLES